METFKFIGWWWGKQDESNRAYFLLLSWIAVSILVALVFQNFFLFFVMFFGGAVTFGVFILFKVLFISIREQWKLYTKEREREADLIVAKLKGR